ncbi:MAG: alpha/beta fold hydrolase, partial [Gammaproteobacteria bacterium]
MKNPPPILTVHGLWNRGPEAWLLRRRLKRLTGRPVLQFRYPSVARGFSRNAERLASSIEQGPGPVDLVGHSLGGLLVMEAIRRVGAGAVRRVVLLAA